ncbi:type I-E CRISPR-associated protein Cas6/Cse3/CasE [Streptomyces sp. 35G-GA-8]|uniref:type I-E CRISPR-associated protein Cas6/Cse3/CasE n=1 Tax=Streptomyces sp. 35G-GA-8 TaxID=2939434 RepID=UPI00201EF88A|nr:type I-E CRISPR-associated protein Cas6/Cse3/CasE [Streptomyces sp. 35G-GA-8]MCL7381285.1 type I-E CRISPR-associated protein Cas6/Cse3/CasE [Streptomyces sp. 35G-GA-8]
MFLTRFRFNTARMGARRLLTAPQSLHAAVMASFAEKVDHQGGGPRVLWRLDQDSRSDVLLYIVSPHRPDLTHLVEQAGWPTTGSWQTAPYAPFLARLAPDDTWAFRLTANPVHSTRRHAAEPTKRTAHVTPRHQLDWLLKRQTDAGFAIVERPERLPDGRDGVWREVVVHNRHDLTFGKKDQSDGRAHEVKLTRVTYDGRLRVLDPDTLRRTLTVGLGKAKAYGCGLMTLAPAE